MKCPMCHKIIDQKFAHCPFCGNQVMQAKKGIGGLNIALIVLSAVQIVTAAAMMIMLSNGEIAAFYLRGNNYSKATSLIGRFSGSANNNDVIRETKQTVQKLQQDYIDGKVEFDSANSTMELLKSVSNDDTAQYIAENMEVLDVYRRIGELPATLDELNAKKQYPEIMAEIETLERLCEERRKYISDSEHDKLTERKHFFYDQWLDEKLDADVYFTSASDERDLGALGIAAVVCRWDTGKMREVNLRCKNYYTSFKNYSDLLKAVCEMHAAGDELIEYRGIEGFKPDDYTVMIDTKLSIMEKMQEDALHNLITNLRTKQMRSKLINNENLKKATEDLTNAHNDGSEMITGTMLKYSIVDNIKPIHYTHYETADDADAYLQVLRADQTYGQNGLLENKNLLYIGITVDIQISDEHQPVFYWSVMASEGLPGGDAA